MSRRVYADGVLVAEWDDDARQYRGFEGGKWVARPYDQNTRAKKEQRALDLLATGDIETADRISR